MIPRRFLVFHVWILEFVLCSIFRTRKRQCVNGMAGLQGCPGSLYDDDSCNTQVGFHWLKKYLLNRCRPPRTSSTRPLSISIRHFCRWHGPLLSWFIHVSTFLIRSPPARVRIGLIRCIWIPIKAMCPWRIRKGRIQWIWNQTKLCSYYNQFISGFDYVIITS